MAGIFLKSIVEPVNVVKDSISGVFIIMNMGIKEAIGAWSFIH